MTSAIHDGWFTPELLAALCALGTETQWCEFKLNNVNPEKVGDTLAALANGARLQGEPFGYLVFGVADSLACDGTTVRLASERKGAMPLLEWLNRVLQPRPQLVAAVLEGETGRFVAIRIPACSGQPTAFQNRERIRIQGRNQSLRDYPEHARTLWERLSGQTLDSRTISGPHTPQELAAQLDLSAYARLRGLGGPPPLALLTVLQQDGMIHKRTDGKIDITALGALLLAKQLSRFPEFERRAVRVIEYPGTGRTELGLREYPGQRGYAAAFAGLLGFVMERLPATEALVDGVRQSLPVYPLVALREFIANALIHQDLTMTGVGPLVELFPDRVEISNPGVPLSAPERLLDLPPQSRNERLAITMRRLGLCEERGSGIDRAVEAIEAAQLPAPEILAEGDHTRVIILGPRPLAQMTQADRMRACYQHACLLWVSRAPMTNATLRRRLGIRDRDYSMVSRIIGDAIDAGIVRPFDPESKSRKHAKYVPSWAG